MGKAIKGLFIAFGLFLIYQIPSVILILESTQLADIIFLISMLLVACFGIVLAYKFGYFTNVEKEFSIKNIIVIVAGFMIMRMVAMLFTSLMGEASQNDVAIQEVLENKSPLVMFVMICVGAPILEEIIFRGIIINYVFRGYENEKKFMLMEVLGLLSSSLLFGMIHLSSNPISSLMYFTLGLLLGLVYTITKSLKCSIIVHFLNNFLPFLAMIGIFG